MAILTATHVDIPAPTWPRSKFLAGLSLVGALAAWPASAVVASTPLLTADFNTNADDFTYQDDAFDPNQPGYASGTHTSSGGYGGSGGLQVTLGGGDDNEINGMSGGWSYTLDLAEAQTGVVLSFRYKLTQSATYEYDEYSRVLVAVDGLKYGRGAKDYVDHVSGDGTSGSGNGPGNRNVFTPTTEWQQHQVYLGELAVGPHLLVLGGYNHKKNAADEITTLVIDDVAVTSGNAAPVSDVQTLVNRVSQEEYLSHIQGVAQFNDRCRMSGCSSADYLAAVTWLEGELQALGYETYRHNSSTSGTSTTNLWATKLGETTPGQMYMISAHLDGRSGGDAFDDDGSGVAVVLEAARVFAGDDVTTDKSVRFLFWDKDEIGYKGADNYVRDRRLLQGNMTINPPEPTWLGLITHDMVLYDHGVGSGGANQSIYADLDVEWRAGTTKEAASKALANDWRYFNGTYSTHYPASAWNYSYYTDDGPFWPYVASVSVRENRRILDGSITDEEWINPYYHTTGDVEASYSEADIRLGYNAAQATIGAVAELAGASIDTNKPPTATLQAVTLNEDTAVAITLTGADDDDGDSLAFSVVTGPTKGTLSGTAPNLTYTPDPDYFGPDSFTFVVNDGRVNSAPATVGITVENVNDPPVVFDQAITIAPNTSVAITLTAEDPDGDALVYVIKSQPTDGTLTGTAPNLTYTPATDFLGIDEIWFSVTDAAGAPSAKWGYVGIAVAIPDNPPVAYSDSVTTNENTSVAITLTGSDPDGDTLFYEVLTDPGHGELSGSVPDLTYTPATDYSGPDSFSFRVIAVRDDDDDGTYESVVPSDPATIEILVGTVAYVPLLSAGFDTGAQGFVYGDDSFRGTSQASYASGTWGSSFGASGGGLRVLLGGRDDRTIRNMSGGWRTDFTLDRPRQVRVSVRVNLTQSSEYESDEYSEALVSINGVLVGQGGTDYLARVVGNGNGGSARSTGWQTYELDLGTLAAGTHRLIIGGYNNKKTYRDESTEVRIDDVVISAR
jgi:hypothetical protein